MNIQYIAIVTIILFAICSAAANEAKEDITEIPSRIDSCDLRKAFGTCVEYSINELGDWYLQFVEKACPENRRGQFVGEYKKATPCPPENRVARCENIVEMAGEPYEYDKHYYADLAEVYSWRPADVRVSCDNVAGRFISEIELPASLFHIGNYQITSRTIMPNLAENLRYASSQEQHCLTHADPVLLFPIINHESLQGCRFANKRRQDSMITYQLVCKSSQVASGVAKIESKPDYISGVLDIQMGGKNMTFSQYSEARWQRGCE